MSVHTVEPPDPDLPGAGVHSRMELARVDLEATLPADDADDRVGA